MAEWQLSGRPVFDMKYAMLKNCGTPPLRVRRSLLAIDSRGEWSGITGRAMRIAPKEFT